MGEINLKFEINFNNAIFEVFDEAAFMEQLGFPLPVEMRSLALQKDKIFRNNQNVEMMLKEYNELVSQLTMPEVRRRKEFVTD